MALVERDGRVRSFHVPNVNANNLHPIIGRHVYADARFQSDETPICMGIGWNFMSYGTMTHSDNTTKPSPANWSVTKTRLRSMPQSRR